MTTLAEVFVMVRPDMKQFAPDLRKDLGKVDVSSATEKAGEKAGDSFSTGFGRGTKKLIAGVGALLLSSKVKDGLKESISASSDLAETQSKVGVIFGKSAKDITKFASTADTALGQSAQAALDANATFGIFGKSAGLKGKNLTDFTTKFTTLASDMASFNNTSPEQAIEAIGAAFRGETEPIRAYGVLLDDASLRQEALRQGLIKTTKSALTPQQKVLAAQGLILKQTTAAQGDFARTSEGLANQQRIAAAQTDKLKVAIGNTFLPAVLQAAHGLNKQLLPGLIGLAEKHGPGVTATLLKIAPAAKAVTDILFKGDFNGGVAKALGLEEDSRAVDVLFRIREAALSLHSVFSVLATGNFTHVIFGQEEDSGTAAALFKIRENGQQVYETLRVIATGDFRGRIFGQEEDSPFANALFKIREQAGLLIERIKTFDTTGLKEQFLSLVDSAGKLLPLVGDFIEMMPGVKDVVGGAVGALSFLADHTETLRKLLPFLVAGVIAYKAAQAAANLAALLSVPTKVAEVAVNRQLVKSNRELIASRAALTVTDAVGTVATGASTTAKAANTTATNAGALATIRQRVATIAASVAQKAVAVATAAWTGAQWLLNVALTANPIGLIVVGIALLVAGLILAYKKSETFRKIVDGAFRAVQTAAAFAFNWVKDNWKLLLGIVTGPIGAAVLIVATHWDSIKSAAQTALKFVVDQFLGFVQNMIDGAAKAFGWVPKLGEKLKTAADDFANFRDDVNARLGGIKDQTITIKPVFDKNTMSLASAGRRAAGGPGGPVRGRGTTTSDQAGLYALSNKEWVIKAKASQKYGDYAMASVNAGTATIIPNGGLATGGRPGLTVRPDIPAAANQAAFASGVASGARAIGQSFSAALAKQLGVNPGLAGALTFAKSQAGKPYVWGGVGPGGYDCSGFMSAITNYIRGRNPYRRVGATGTFPWGGFAPGMGSFAIGSRKGNPGHMAGTLNGVNVESRGGRGVVIGAAARGARDALFGGNVYHLAGLAAGGKAGDAAFDLLDPRGKKFMGRDFLASLGIGPKLFDRGGKWRHGELGLNLSGKTETVRTAEQEAALGRPIEVRVFIGDREFTDMVRVEIDDNDRRKADQFLSGPVY